MTARIKLRCDTYSNWRRSLTPLYEGEVGIGYDVRHNPVTDADEKYNFKIKIGRATGENNYSMWADSADLSFVTDPDTLQQIVDAVVQQIGQDEFVRTRTFNQFKENLDQQLTAIISRLNNRVKAYVNENSLILSTDD